MENEPDAYIKLSGSLPFCKYSKDLRKSIRNAFFLRSWKQMYILEVDAWTGSHKAWSDVDGKGMYCGLIKDVEKKLHMKTAHSAWEDDLPVEE